MNRRDLATELAIELGESRRQTRIIVEAFLTVMGRTLARGESVSFSNFGTLKPITRRASSSDLEGCGADAFRVRFRPSDKLLAALEEGDEQVNFRKRRGSLPVQRRSAE